MRTLAVVLTLSMVTGILKPADLQAAGLRTPFGQVKMEGLKIGKSYSLKQLTNRTYEIVNTGNDPMELRIEPVGPQKHEMAKGYEPIPDPNWIAVERREFVIGPSQEARTDFTVTVPHDEKLLGKKYQVMIQSTSVGTEFIQIGLRSKMLLDISSTPPTIDELKQKLVKKAYGNLNFNLSPYEAHVDDFPLGKKVELAKERNVILKIINPNDETLTFHLQRVRSWESGFGVPAGMEEAPDESVLDIGKAMFKVEANSVTKVSLSLVVPNEERHRGKTYFYLIRTEIMEQETPNSIFFRLAVTTKK